MEQCTPLHVPKNARLILAQSGYSYKKFARVRGYKMQSVINVLNKYKIGTKSVPRGKIVLKIISDFYSLTKESNNAIL